MKQRVDLFLLILPLLILLGISCTKDLTHSMDDVPATSFTFNTSHTVNLTLEGSPAMAGATFELYTEKDGNLFGKGILDASGQFSADYHLATARESIYMVSTYTGFPGDIEIPVNGNRAFLDLNEPLPGTSAKRKSSLTVLTDRQGGVYQFMGDYDAQGVPGYFTVADQVDASLLSDINTALPEQYPVPTYNARYLSNTGDVNLHLTQLCDVWITFVHEGAGYKNVLGYYTYPTANPPASVAEIDTTRIIFPNTSFRWSGGGLQSGDKVHLGSFPAGTSIGWVLFQNAYNPAQQTVDVNKLKFYSETAFNPEPSANLRQHHVQLYHPNRDLVLIGFEDIQRDAGGCDNDFNDAIFYISSNPIQAINKQNLTTISITNNDADGDGVDDLTDEYPRDPDRAFDQYYPDAHNFSSLAFEDLWPNTGDYDFNDLVLDVQYKYVTSATNFIWELEIKLYVKHIGASFKNGFGFEFPFDASQVSSASGSNITEGWVNLLSNGLENGQQKAVVMAFDNAFENLHDTLVLRVQLNQPYNFSLYHQIGLNPFIFTDGKRSQEVHLTDRKPTERANLKLLGQGSDVSNPGTGTYYRSEVGYPWAIEINTPYRHLREKISIREAYKHFDAWVNSNGAQYKDWYSKATSDYRDFSKVE